MDIKIEELSKTTFGGRQFKRNQLATIQKTVEMYGSLSRRELAHTICEHLDWVTPRGTDRVHACLNALEEMEACGLFKLPAKKEQEVRASQKDIPHTEQTKEEALIDCLLTDLMPINLKVVTDKEEIQEYNEYLSRYHYLGYKQPIGCCLRYYVLDREGRKLGCFSCSFATRDLACRDEWIGWTKAHRQKQLHLIINNTRFVLFPWVRVPHLASKALSYAMRQIADDWMTHHGYRPVLVETFVDKTLYEGTCYKASGWQYIGETAGKPSKNNPALGKKSVYIYPLDADAREALMSKKKIPTKRVDGYKKAHIPSDSQVYLWQKIITTVSDVAEHYDVTWQKRRRIISTLLLILFIFRLVFSKNKQGYGTTINELWDYCHRLNIPLPQEKPVVPAAFCNARKKMDESIFKHLNQQIIQTYPMERNDYCWKNHRLFAVDGSKLNLPKELLENAYQKPSSNAYYPQGLVSCLYQLKAKIPFDFDLSPHKDERAMALQHLQVLEPNDLVIYDRGYFSYALLHAHHKKGLQAVFRLASSSYTIISDFIKSSDTERLITIMPTASNQKDILIKNPDIDFLPIQLRLIKYTIDNTTYTLGTTLLDNQDYPSCDFPDLYHARWGIEELYKLSKLLIDVEDFHAKTERGVKQELFAHFVILTLSRIFANQTDDALLLRKNSDETSKTMKTNMKNCLITFARHLEGLFLRQSLFVRETVTIIAQSMATCYQAIRPNRSFVRVSNKVPNKWRSAKTKKNNKPELAASLAA